MPTAKQPRFTLRMSKIYLVGIGEAAHTEVRVTRLNENVSPPIPPATCQFLNVSPDDHGMNVGTLVITEDLWQEWYGKYDEDDFMPGMRTALDAARTMVTTIPSVFFGCPLCNFRTKDPTVAQLHAGEEAQRLLRYYDVEVNDDGTDA